MTLSDQYSLSPFPEEKLSSLQAWMEGLDGPVGVGFSGGVDSAFLVAALLKWCRQPVTAFSVVSSLMSSRQKRILDKTAKELGIRPRLIPWNPLSDEAICSNTGLRCYLCKKRMYCLIMQAGRSEDIRFFLDGTQADDMQAERPGIRAIEECGISKPLADCMLEKMEIRSVLKGWGYSFSARQAESCLATRIQRNTRITKENLTIIENLEDFFRLKGIHPLKIELTNRSIYFFLKRHENECIKRYFKEIERIAKRFTFFFKN